MEVRVVIGGGKEITNPVLIFEQRAIAGHMPKGPEEPMENEFLFDGGGGCKTNARVSIIPPILVMGPHHITLAFGEVMDFGTFDVNLRSVFMDDSPFAMGENLIWGIYGQDGSDEFPLLAVFASV